MLEYNSAIADGAGNNKNNTTPDDSNNIIENSLFTEEDFELKTSTFLTETLDEISDNYTAGYQDLVDAIIQMKTVSSAVNNSETWNEEIVKEALANCPEGIIDICNKYTNEESSTSEITKMLEEMAVDFYNDFNAYGDYAIAIQALVAFVENTLKASIPDEEYKQIMDFIATDEKINSIDLFLNNSYISEYKSLFVNGAIKRMTAGVMTRLGPEALKALVDGNIDFLLMDKEFWKTFAYSGLAYLKAVDLSKINEMFANNGADIADSIIGADGLILNSSEAAIPKVSFKIKGSLIFAGIYLANAVKDDIINDELKVENEFFNVLKAGSIFGAGIAGSAVTSALSGSWFAGPVGSLVAVAANVVGNITVDVIRHITDYTYTEVPRRFEEIDMDKVKKQLEDNNYQIGTPKIDGVEDKSLYDIAALLRSQTNNTDFIYYVIDKAGGFSTLPSETKEEIDFIFKWIKETAINDPKYAISSCEEYYDITLSQIQKDFANTYFDVFFKNKYLPDDELFDLYLEVIYAD